MAREMWKCPKIKICSGSGPRSRQSSVETDGMPPMNTEEVYRNLRKTTAEIQNYSFETKLGRDTNSKDSGISQMDDHQTALGGVNEPLMMQQQQHHYYAMNPTNQLNVNGFNGLLSSEGDSCNGSKTQSATTTESNTPENTVRLEGINAKNIFVPKHSTKVTFLPNGEIVTECKSSTIRSNWNRTDFTTSFLSVGAKESDILNDAIALSPNHPTNVIVQTLADLTTCIKYGNCELPIKHFKWVLVQMCQFYMENSIQTFVSRLG